MSEPALDLDTLPDDLDFTRYAPAPQVQRPALVWSQPEVSEPGELEIAVHHMGAAIALFWRCMRLAIAIIWSRITMPIVLFYHSTAQSLDTAWTLAGIGWGLFGVWFIAAPFIY